MGIYEQLKIRRLINGWDTISSVGGSLMEKETLDAMCQAGTRFYEMKHFIREAGEEIARLTHNEAACVTGGSSAGILLAVSVCIAGGFDLEKLMKLPNSKGLENRVVMMCGHRNHYDYAVRSAGGAIMQTGISWVTEPWELAGVLSEKPAALLYAASQRHSRYGLPLKECVRLAHKEGVPVIVDAAAQLPPVKNLWEFANAGADVVLFSGGKSLLGPQSVGFAVGTRLWIDAMERFMLSEVGLASTVLVGKEGIMGLIKAVRSFTEPGNEERRFTETKRLAMMITDKLNESGIFQACLFEETALGQQICCSKAKITSGISGSDLIRELREKKGILIGPGGDSENMIVINPLLLSRRDCEVLTREMVFIAERLAGCNE